MLEPLILLLPIYLLILLGFGMVKSGLIAPEAMPHLSRFVLIVCIPVLVFSAVSSAGSLTEFNWSFIAAYACAALLVLVIARVVLRRVFGLGPGRSWIAAQGACSPNTLFLGFPIASTVMPEIAPLLFAWIMVVENMVVIPASVTIADVLSREHALPPRAALRDTARRTLSNPTVIGLLAGLAYAAIGFELPHPIETTRSMILSAAPLLSLFVVGANMAGARLNEVEPAAMILAGMKLLLHPLITFLVLSAIPSIPPDYVLCATLFSAMPMFALYAVFAARLGVGRLASSALVLSTLGGALSVGVLVLIAAG